MAQDQAKRRVVSDAESLAKSLLKGGAQRQTSTEKKPQKQSQNRKS